MGPKYKLYLNTDDDLKQIHWIGAYSLEGNFIPFDSREEASNMKPLLLFKIHASGIKPIAGGVPRIIWHITNVDDFKERVYVFRDWKLINMVMYKHWYEQIHIHVIDPKGIQETVEFAYSCDSSGITMAFQEFINCAGFNDFRQYKENVSLKRDYALLTTEYENLKKENAELKHIVDAIRQIFDAKTT